MDQNKKEYEKNNTRRKSRKRKRCSIRKIVGRDAAVVTATRYELDGPGI
jgi:hypothetical protein